MLEKSGGIIMQNPGTGTRTVFTAAFGPGPVRAGAYPVPGAVAR